MRSTEGAVVSSF